MWWWCCFFCTRILLPPPSVDASHPPFLISLTPGLSTRAAAAAAAAAAGFHRVTQVPCDLIISQSELNAQSSRDYSTIETTDTSFLPVMEAPTLPSLPHD